MRKLLVVLLLGVIWAGKSEAAGPTRGAKGSISMVYALSGSSVAIVSGSAVVYSIIMSTGATGDFVVLFDSASLNGLASTTSTSVMKTRCMAGSTITTTMCNYDPPLQFNLGLAAVNSTVNNSALIVYEKGRVTQGY